MKRKYLFVLVLIISSFIYSQKAATLEHLIQPKNIHVDADRIYITDYPEIHIYSITDYKLLKTFKKEAGKSEVQIFDLKGTLLEKTMVPIKEKNSKRFFPYDINKGVLYQLVENDDEEWELHVTKIH